MMEKNRENVYPKFSVLITVYGEEKAKNLDSALESIKNQSVIPNEIVLVEDGPLGSELENIIKKHRNNFTNDFKVVKLIRNSGRGIASGVGIAFISNNWVARIDSDDISKRDRFKLQLQAIIHDPSLKMVGGQIQEFLNDDTCNIVGKRTVPLKYEDIKKYAKYRSPINNPSIMFRKDVLHDIGGYPRLNVMEDYDLCVKFISKGFKIINLPEVLVNMRVDQGLYSRRGGIKYLLQYITMKMKWKKLGIGDSKSVLLSIIFMTCNTIFPTWLRKIIYRKILHRYNK